MFATMALCFALSGAPHVTCTAGDYVLTIEEVDGPEPFVEQEGMRVLDACPEDLSIVRSLHMQVRMETTFFFKIMDRGEITEIAGVLRQATPPGPHHGEHIPLRRDISPKQSPSPVKTAGDDLLLHVTYTRTLKNGQKLRLTTAVPVQLGKRTALKPPPKFPTMLWSLEASNVNAKH